MFNWARMEKPRLRRRTNLSISIYVRSGLEKSLFQASRNLTLPTTAAWVRHLNSGVNVAELVTWPSFCSATMDELSALPPENWKHSRQPRRDSLPTMPAETGPIFGSPSYSQKQVSLSVDTSVWVLSLVYWPFLCSFFLLYLWTVLAVSAQSDMPVILAPTPRRHLIESSASKHWLHNPSITPPSSRPVSALSQNDRHFRHTTRSSGVSQQYHVGPGPSQSPASVLQSNITTSPNAIRRRRFSGSVSQQPRNLHEVPEHEQGEGESKHIKHHSGSGTLPGDSSYGTVRVTGGGLRMYAPEPEESAMGRRWLRWMHKRGLKQWVVPGLICASTMVKLMVGLGPYSGMCFFPSRSQQLKYTYFQFQARIHHRCMATLRHRGIGWRLRNTFHCKSGIHMIYSIGVLITPR